MLRVFIPGNIVDSVSLVVVTREHNAANEGLCNFSLEIMWIFLVEIIPIKVK